MPKDEYIKCQLKIILNKQLYEQEKIGYDTYIKVENDLLNQILKLTKKFEKETKKNSLYMMNTV